METQTNLRALRLRYNIFLTELEQVSGLPNQYISRAELGEIGATTRLEEQLGDAVEAVIYLRAGQVRGAVRDLRRCRGRLLQPAMEDNYEQ